MDADSRWMQAAIGLARRGLGGTWPRPSVGCVLVREGRVVGRGRTSEHGEPPRHAEVAALAIAGSAARGATAYVTLEPCAHHGATPPCAEALVAAGVTRVVTALDDPDPRVSGRGLAILRKAGIDVTEAVETVAAEEATLGFLTRQLLGRPAVTLKLATTLDGRIATDSGESRWITGEAARTLVHLMRAQSDAVMVGAGTARADDPLLDIRIEGLRHRRPLRIVTDGGLSVQLTSRLVSSARNHPLMIAHRHGADRARLAALHDAGAQTLECKAGTSGELDLAALLGALGDKGVGTVLVEGGGRLAAALLRAGLVDRLALFQAGKMIGEDGVAAVGPLALARLADAPGFVLQDTRQIGADVVSLWKRAGSG